MSFGVLRAFLKTMTDVDGPFLKSVLVHGIFFQILFGFRTLNIAVSVFGLLAAVAIGSYIRSVQHGA